MKILALILVCRIAYCQEPTDSVQTRSERLIPNRLLKKPDFRKIVLDTAMCRT